MDKGRKIEDEVAEENGQEAGKYTRREQLRIAELKPACRKRILLISGVCVSSASWRGYFCAQITAREQVGDANLDARILSRVLFQTINSPAVLIYHYPVFEK
ncbi:hypothetical protein H5410_005543 [Solanum commersonii]|uniref:Uncharacterized protein n=1 Tax=Solanum commersonii TaxID=4109 RepID=A0A9J6A6W7_SOLCO|nr:hypothetical protein H5410_005543 [Solanum commersonii]